MRRMLSLILALSMVLSLIEPTAVAASEVSKGEAVSSIADVSEEPSPEVSPVADSQETESPPAGTDTAAEEPSEGETDPSKEQTEAESSASEEPVTETSPQKDGNKTEESAESPSVPVQTGQPTQEESTEVPGETVDVVGEKSLRETLHTADGKTYTVTVTYDRRAAIPDGTELTVKELNQELSDEEKELAENEDRPFDSETFVSAKALEQELFDLQDGLSVKERDYVLFSKFIDLALVYNGKTLRPRTPVTVTIETNQVEQGASDTLEVGVYSRDKTVQWQSARKELVDEQNEKIKDGTLKRADAQRFPVKVFEPAVIRNETEKNGKTTVSFSTDRVTRIGILGVAEELERWQVKDAQVSVYGARNLSAKVNNEDMDEPEAGVEKVEAFSVEVSEPEGLAPEYPVTFWVGTESDSVTDDAAAGVVVSQLSDGTADEELIGVEGSDAPIPIQAGDAIGVLYDSGLRDRTVEAENITVSGMMPKGAELTADDVTDSYSRPEQVNQDVEEGKAETKTAVDITITGKNGDFQPDEDGLSVTLSNLELNEDSRVEVWHVRDNGTVEVISDVTVDGDSVSFTATGFSVYMVVEYTVDFHWGDYTYNLAGGQELFVSTLLNRLGASSQSEDSSRLLALAEDMDQVENVTFSDPELVKVEQVDSEQAENDWLLTSLAPFSTQEELTLFLTDGSRLVIRVTDEMEDGVARVSNDGGATWTYYDRLISEGGVTGAFTYANTLTGNVIVETLKETDPSYTMTSGVTFNNAKITSLTIRTAEGVGRSTLTKTHKNPMITFSIANAPLTVENLVLLAGGENTKVSVSGGAIQQTSMGAGSGLTLKQVDFGALNEDGVTADMDKAFVSNTRGGAVYTAVNTHITVENCNFYGSKASCGGGLYYDKGNASQFLVTFSGTKFIDCLATNEYGAAFSGWYNSGSPAAKQTTIENCVFRNCISNNTYSGAAIVRTVNLDVVNSTFENCHSVRGNHGGALWISTNGNGILSFTGTTFENCYTTGYGGALGMEGAPAQFNVTGCF